MGDRVGGEEGGGASEGAGAKAGGGERVGGGGEAGREEVPGEGMGEDGLGVAVCEEADVGDGWAVGRGVEEEGVGFEVKSPIGRRSSRDQSDRVKLRSLIVLRPPCPTPRAR